MQFSLIGLAVATVFYAQSLQPSLLPLGVVSQIIFSGLVTALGYDVGLLVEFVFKRFGLFPKHLFPRNRTYLITAALLLVGLCLSWKGFAVLQEQRSLLEIITPVPSWLLVFSGALVVAFLVLRAGTLIRAIARFFATHIRVPYIETAVSVAIWVLVAALGYAVFSFSIFVLQASLDISSRPKNTEMLQPASSLRSGGPGSFVSWQNLGQKGKEFVSRDTVSLDPKAAGLFEGLPQKTVEPVRIYASIGNESDLEKRVELIMKELERTHAFERSVVVFFTPSGTGWVDPIAVEAVEYITRGDAASVSLQYANNQALVQYLSDKDLPGKASALLFSKIRQRLDVMPEAKRPKFYIYGESLGSRGSQQIFSGQSPEEITRSIDGALWIGSPSSAPLWDSLALPQLFGADTNILPDHRIVRVVAHAKDLVDTPESWGPRRLAFLYNATDPIVWFNRRVAYQYPDWLKEPRAPQISRHMHWRPLLSFGHLWFELFSAKRAPSGIGHNYDMEIPCAVANMMQANIEEMCHSF